jgi:hypothetical protein
MKDAGKIDTLLALIRGSGNVPPVNIVLVKHKTIKRT